MPKIITLLWLYIASQFPLGFIGLNIMTKQKGKGRLRQLEHLGTKIQESTSNVAITGKKEGKTISQNIAEHTTNPWGIFR